MLATAALAATLLAAMPTVSLEKLLAKPTTKVRSQTSVPILLPKAFPMLQPSKLYAATTATRASYEFRLTTTRTCTANFCFAATLRGQVGNARYSGRTVKLAKGRTGRWEPLTCGASCAPASISWRERGSTYSIEAMIPRGSERAELTAMANQAIKRGPR